MIVELLNESGYEQAIKGMSLSYYDGKEPMDTWWEGQRDKAKGSIQVSAKGDKPL